MDGTVEYGTVGNAITTTRTVIYARSKPHQSALQPPQYVVSITDLLVGGREAELTVSLTEAYLPPVVPMPMAVLNES